MLENSEERDELRYVFESIKDHLHNDNISRIRINNNKDIYDISLEYEKDDRINSTKIGITKKRNILKSVCLVYGFKDNYYDVEII